LAELLDLAAQHGLAVEPLPRNAGATRDLLKVDLGSLGDKRAERDRGALHRGGVLALRCCLKRA
jgi:hypothetical protein